MSSSGLNYQWVRYRELVGDREGKDCMWIELGEWILLKWVCELMCE